jgi:hypothetical protein
MSDLVGWASAVAVLVAAATALLVAIERHSRKPVDEKYQGDGGGLGAAFDAVWSPTAHEAGIDRDRQTQRTAPAPSPGDPPDAIDDSDGSIRIDI